MILHLPATDMRPTVGKPVLAAILLLAGICAAAAPFVADLLTAIAGTAVCYCLVLALWTGQQRGTGSTTKLLEAV